MSTESLIRQEPSGEITTAATSLPVGVLDQFRARQFPSAHPQAFLDLNGRAIRATTQPGFLLFGQYKTGYPVQELEAVFYLYIDNNTFDDAYICIVDVVENKQRVVAKKIMTRRDFPEAKKHLKIGLPFKVTSQQATYEFRVYYIGYAYFAVDGVFVIDPALVMLDQLPARVDEAPQPELQPEPQPQRGYCRGDELVCIDRFSSDLIKQKQGIFHGGSYQNGTFTPSNRGGIEFQFNLDTGRNFVVEMEIEGNIANAHLGEQDGGKVALFDIGEAHNGPYNLQFQRMYASYRGGGRFRVILGIDSHQSAFLITTPDLAGDYSMKNWGPEPHKLKVEVSGSRCRLIIDQYVSKWISGPIPIGGTRQVILMIGNRLERYDNQHAITMFKHFRLTYT